MLNLLSFTVSDVGNCNSKRISADPGKWEARAT